MAKMKSKRDARAKSDTLNPKTGAKRHTNRKHSPPLVPEPEKLTDLLRLVNLFPVPFDNPYQYDIAYWQPGEMTRDVEAALRTGKDIQTEQRRNPWDDLYLVLSNVLYEMPLEIQAFVLRDDHCEVGEWDGVTTWKSIPPHIQLACNFDVLSRDIEELAAIVHAAHTRISRTLELEDQAKRETLRIGGKQYVFLASEKLLSRARHRLLSLLAAREVLKSLTKPDAWARVLDINESKFSGGALAGISIVHEKDKKGENTSRVAVAPPVLYGRLEGVDSTRIRECPICHKIFWAGRKDQSGCSDNCRAAQRSRTYRKNYKRKYAHQRANQRQAKTRAMQEKAKPKRGKKSA